MIFRYQFLSNDYAGKFEFSLSEMGILTRSSTTQTTSLPNISGITITQKACAGIWPSKMKNNGLHFPILRKDQNMEDRIVYILFPRGLS